MGSICRHKVRGPVLVFGWQVATVLGFFTEAGRTCLLAEEQEEKNMQALPTASRTATIKLQIMFNPITFGSPSMYLVLLTGSNEQ